MDDERMALPRPRRSGRGVVLCTEEDAVNERIEAYLKQHFCHAYFTAYGESVEDEHYFMYREEVDGLIELIVRECICLCDQVDLVGADECIDAIKEHFGVEK